MKNDGLPTVLIREDIAKRETCGVLFVKDLTEVLSKAVEIFEKDKMLLPGSSGMPYRVLTS